MFHPKMTVVQKQI